MGESRQEREDLMSYVDSVLETVIARNPGEAVFHQAVREVLDSLRLAVDANPNYQKNGRWSAWLSRSARSCSVCRGWMTRAMCR